MTNPIYTLNSMTPCLILQALGPDASSFLWYSVHTIAMPWCLCFVLQLPVYTPQQSHFIFIWVFFNGPRLVFWKGYLFNKYLLSQCKTKLAAHTFENAYVWENGNNCSWTTILTKCLCTVKAITMNYWWVNMKQVREVPEKWIHM